MRDARDLVISVASRELQAIRPPGSVFPAEALAGAAISRELRLALAPITASAEPPALVVARPEIFTHGESLRWLRGEIGAARQHLAFSDGTTISLLPGLANHVFFHGVGRRADAAALNALEGRVPELFEQVQSQVNTAYRFGESRHAPDCYVWPGRAEARGADAGLLRFYAHGSLEESVARILYWGEVFAREGGFVRLTYIPLTETSLDDRDFLRAVAGEVLRAFFKPETAVVLRLPSPGAPDEARVEATLRALATVQAPIPGIPSGNVYFALDDAPVSQLAALAPTRHLLAHDSFEFWRHPLDYYAGFGSLRVAARRRRHAPEALPVLLAELTGREVTLLWPSPREKRPADWRPL